MSAHDWTQKARELVLVRTMLRRDLPTATWDEILNLCGISHSRSRQDLELWAHAIAAALSQAYEAGLMERQLSDPKWDGFKIAGSTGCATCDGSVIMFTKHDRCIECDPKAYENSPLTLSEPRPTPPASRRQNDEAEALVEALEKIMEVTGTSTLQWKIAQDALAKMRK